MKEFVLPDSDNEEWSVSTEEELILAIQSGNTESFRELVLVYQTQIFAFTYRQVQNNELAEELTQDTFVRAFRGIENFRFESSFSTWLYRIAINVCKSYFSSRYFIESKNTDLVEPNNENLLNRSNLDSIDRQEIYKIVILAQELSDKLKNVFILCALEQKTYEEVSEILQIPVGTVRSRLNKARERIKTKYFLNSEEK